MAAQAKLISRKLHAFTIPQSSVHQPVTCHPYILGQLRRLPGAVTKSRGSMNDFTQLLEEQIPRLRRYARALTRDVYRADDLVQSCLERAIAKQHLWQPGTDLRAWLFTILHNQHVNEVRRAVRKGIEVQVEDAAPVLRVESNVNGKLALRDLEAAIAK